MEGDECSTSILSLPPSLDLPLQLVVMAGCRTSVQTAVYPSAAALREDDTFAAALLLVRPSLSLSPPFVVLLRSLRTVLLGPSGLGRGRAPSVRSSSFTAPLTKQLMPSPLSAFSVGVHYRPGDSQPEYDPDEVLDIIQRVRPFPILAFAPNGAHPTAFTFDSTSLIQRVRNLYLCRDQVSSHSLIISPIHRT